MMKMIMKRTIVIGVLVLLGGSVAASPTGGRMADLLYANSLYGISNPLPSPALTPYALSVRQIRRQKREDITVGILGNMLVPGLGSAIIGDPNAKVLVAGYGISILAAVLGVEVIALGSIGHQQSAINPLPWEILSGVGLGSATFFYVWGLFSPAHYVRRKDYSK